MKCDKCNKETKKNSVIKLQELGKKPCPPLTLDRHLYPTENCEGSPSRVKIIKSNEFWNKIWKQLQEQA